MRLALVGAAAVGLLVGAGGGCSQHACPALCRYEQATLDLSCGATDLKSEILSGPCNALDSSVPQVAGSNPTYVTVPAYGPGVCHIQLVFANGFTFSTDVTFTEQTDDSDPQCPCKYLHPSPQTIAVNNPGSTCVDASPEAAVAMPTMLAQGQSGALALAVDPVDAYWTDESGSAVMRVPTSGGTPNQLSHEASPAGIAVDSAAVYWTDFTSNGSVVMLAKGSSAAPTTLASGQSYPGGVAVDGTSAYWTNSANGGAGMGSIAQVPLGGGTPKTLATGQNNPNGIAVGGANVYWANFGTNGTDGAILKVPVGGGAVTTLATGQAGPNAIAVDASNVYWANFVSPGSVVKMPLAGGAATTLASGQGGAAYLALDATNLYWTADGTATSAVMKVALGGGTPVTLASQPTNATGIAVDETSVYWLTSDPGKSDGALWKLSPK